MLIHHTTLVSFRLLRKNLSTCDSFWANGSPPSPHPPRQKNCRELGTCSLAVEINVTFLFIYYPLFFWRRTTRKALRHTPKHEALWSLKPSRVGINPEKNPDGGYGYFLEPHILMDNLKSVSYTLSQIYTLMVIIKTFSSTSKWCNIDSRS